MDPDLPPPEHIAHRITITMDGPGLFLGIDEFPMGVFEPMTIFAVCIRERAEGFCLVSPENLFRFADASRAMDLRGGLRGNGEQPRRDCGQEGHEEGFWESVARVVGGSDDFRKQDQRLLSRLYP